MKIALDPYMHRHLDLPGICRLVAELGYDQIELSPRSDFLEWWSQPRVYPERIQSFKQAMKDHGVQLATLQPMYRWSSPIEDERQIAMRYWKRAIEVSVEMGCDTMISEFGRGASPERSQGTTINSKEACEAAFWRSMDELVPIFEREGVVLSIEPHPEDWVETFHPAVDIIRSINSPQVKMSYIAPHTFYYGDDMAAMLREAAPVLAHVRVADTFNHKASSVLRYIVNPPMFACTNTSTWGRARLTGMCFSKLWQKSNLMAFYRRVCSLGKKERRRRRVLCDWKCSVMWINTTNNVRGTLFVLVAIKRPTTGVLLHGGGWVRPT